MKSFESVLTLEKLVFDKLEFNRKGFKNEDKIVFGIEVNIGTIKELHKVTLILKGDKKNEYDFTISISGYFAICKENVEKALVDDLINKNAVAILMPYLRSEVSLLTAQPNVECVVLPPFNINKMMEDESEE